MSDWPFVAIGSVAEVFDGPHATPKTVDQGPLFLGISSLHNGRIVLGETRHVTEDDFFIWTRRVEPRFGDIVFSYETRLGEAAAIPQGMRCCLGRRMALVRPNSQKLSSPFFLYYFLSPEFQEVLRKNTITGATVDRIALKEFPKFEIRCPSLEEQSQAVQVLQALDDKIELNRRMNETLEAQARALFRDWFVDFGPVKAKMSGDTPYLAPDLWPLFPNRFDDDGVPEGWEVLSLDEVADFLNGLALQKFPASDSEDSLPVIKIADLRTGPTLKSNRASTDLPEKYIIDDGDFIFSWSGSLLAKFWTHGPGALNQHLFKVTSDRFPAWFYSHWVWHHLAEFQLIAASKATTMGHIKRGHLKEAMCVVPSPDLLEELSAIMEPLVERTIANELENRTLAKTRDLLLPKLMSGEIRVGDAASEKLSAA